MSTKIRGAILGRLLLFICLVTIVIVVGMRDVSVGTDTANYVRNYYRVQECACLEENYELGFQVLTLMIASTGAPPSAYLSVLAGLLIFLVWLFLNNVTSLVGYSKVLTWKLRLATLGVILVSPFFFSASVNVLRHGLSAFFVLNAAMFMLRGRWSRVILFALMAALFHKTGVAYLAILPAWVLTSTRRRRNFFYVGLLGLAAAYGIGLTEEIVRVFSSISGVNVYGLFADYGASVTHYRRGVRWDFLVFSFAWFIGGIVLTRGFIGRNHRPIYQKIVDLYGFFLIPFLMFGWGNFSDRLLVVPWQLIPLLVSGAIVFGRLRTYSRGAVYILGLVGAAVILVISVIQNRAFVSWLLQGGF